MALVTALIFKSGGKKIAIPWFIFYFIIAIVLNTYFMNGMTQVGHGIASLARKGLILTMFFIGASLSVDVLKNVGVRPLIQGVLLWITISLLSLGYILIS